LRTPNFQQFSALHQQVNRTKGDLAIRELSDAFAFVVLPLVVEIDEDDFEQLITANSFQRARGKPAGHDRGTDAIVIQTDGSQSTVHFFNLKYSSTFEKTGKFFPSGEIDKVVAFIRAVLSKDAALLGDTNQALTDKVHEIWAELEDRPTKFVIHFCSNLADGFAPDEEARLKTTLAEFSTFTYQVETQASIAARLADKNRSRIDGRFKGIHKNLFELSGGNVRALIVHAEASQILRLLCDNAVLRNDPSNTDLAVLRATKLEEGAFDDNVRIYLKQKPKVNQNIKATALSSENAKFFYFNNGLTMTCDRLDYPTNTSGPIITLENVQVVNGGQTLHALFEAFTTDQSAIAPIELLCRVYETKDRELSSRIAERTNSQSPVATRDIHSIDIEQITLEREFEALGLFYERKKAQYYDKPADKRIDAEKCGQVYLAFYEEMPLEAKNRKGIIFGTKYDDIFSSTTSAEKLLLPFELFNEIEAFRAKNASGRRAWLAYASYHILFALKKVAEKRKLALIYSNRAKISALLNTAIAAVRKARNAERDSLTSAGEDFADVLYFKQKKAADHMAALI